MVMSIKEDLFLQWRLPRAKKPQFLRPKAYKEKTCTMRDALPRAFLPSSHDFSMTPLLSRSAIPTPQPAAADGSVRADPQPTVS